jgi:tripartite-type tricarboxylate transporter receptor subunit TctC
LRVIAVSTPQRLAAWPEVPTLAEDLPGFTALVWIGLFGTRSATPTANTELIEFARSTLSEAAVRDRIESTSGLQPLMIEREGFTRLIAEDLKRYRALLRTALGDGVLSKPRGA